MIKVKFKNLNKSKFIEHEVSERISFVISKFDVIDEKEVVTTVEMENSPLQAGPDLFKIKVHINSGSFARITLEKENQNLFAALAEVSDHLLEVLSRTNDKTRVRERKKARDLLRRSGRELTS